MITYLIFGLYFLMISLWRYHWGFNLPWLWLGGILGLELEWIDRWIYIYWTRPEDQLSIYFKHLIKQKQYKIAIKTVISRGNEQCHLVSKSVIFLLIWVVIAVYVATSTGSILATGLVLGSGLKLGMNIIADWRQPEKLKKWLFWQIKREVSSQELRLVVGFYGLMFGLVTLLVI
jgi:hypothetical protein